MRAPDKDFSITCYSYLPKTCVHSALPHRQTSHNCGSRYPPSSSSQHESNTTSTQHTPTKINLHKKDMAAQPAPNPPLRIPSKSIKMETIPLYGILVTQKSFLIGKRALALQHHAHRLAHRVVGTRLPAELRDEIGAELRKLYDEAAARLWKRMRNDPAARLDRFRFDGATDILTMAELAGKAIYDQLSKRGVAGGLVEVRAREISVDLLGAAKGEERGYVHLSAALVRPSITMMVPGVAVCSGGPSLCFAKGDMRVKIGADCAAHSARENVSVGWKDGEAGGVKSLVQFDDLEASMRGWDQGLIEDFVRKLGLVVLGVHGEEGLGDGMKPQFRIFRDFSWT